MTRTDLPGNLDRAYVVQSSLPNLRGPLQVLCLLADPYAKLRSAKITSCISCYSAGSGCSSSFHLEPRSFIFCLLEVGGQGDLFDLISRIIPISIFLCYIWTGIRATTRAIKWSRYPN